MNTASQIRFIDNIYKPITEQIQDLFINCNHGTKVLDKEAECDQYIALYGGHHFYKLYAAFPSTKFQYTEGKNVEIIDWGCGQALASCTLIDYFIEKQIKPNIESITLVDPSSIALCRGYYFVRQMLQSNFSRQPVIKIVNKYMDDVNFNDFISSDRNIKIHLFSNIIDIRGFDLDKLYCLIINRFQGINRIICTSPYNPNRDRLNSFYNLFCQYPLVTNDVYSDNEICKEILKISSRRFELSRITRFERQFTIKL